MEHRQHSVELSRRIQATPEAVWVCPMLDLIAPR